MKRFRFERFGLFLWLLIVVANGIAAQSRERDNPIPLSSNELNGDLDGSGDEYFYSFVAGPGEVKITVDVRSFDGTANISFELLNKDAAKALICCEFAQADLTGESGRNVKTVKLNRRQTLVLHLTQGPSGRGTYRIRLSGSVLLKNEDEDR
jgi:hypothetical protein